MPVSEEVVADPVIVDVRSRARAAAPGWFPELDVHDVVHIETLDRAWTRVHRLEVRGTRGTARLLAKQYVRTSDEPSRPRLGHDDDRDAKHAFEYATLRAVADRIEGAGTFTVRALDHLPAHRTLVTEEVPADELRDRLLDHLRSPRRALAPPVASAARWLAHYHRCPAPPEELRGTRDDVAAALDTFGAFLTEAGRFTGEVAGLVRAARRALPTLPNELPMGLVHGDAAARNVLVDPRGRVAMIDPLGRRRVPVYEDVATFTVTLRTSPAVAVTRLRPGGRDRVKQITESFVTSYCAVHDTDPAPIPVFEALIVLDRLAAAVTRRTARWRRSVELLPLLVEVRRLTWVLGSA